jgi:glycosyltransferase involved in cell wall biosynthesis
VVSIVMPFHDAERYLEEAVSSVLRQSYGSWELLLVDDGSTDGSSVRARRYAENHPGQVRYLEHPGHANLGAGPSRNVGISRADGEFLAFLDADDALLPHKLSRQLNLLQRHSTSIMVYGATEYWTSWIRRRRRDRAIAAASSA